MPNWCDTNIIITGPDAEIERLKQTAFVLPPTEDCDGFNLDHADWRAPTCVKYSTYCVKDGSHWCWIRSTEAGPVVESLEKISALFPALTFDITVNDEFFNFAYKGPVKAGVVDLHKDTEAMWRYDAAMREAGA